MAQINVKDAAGNTVAIEAPNPNGRQDAAASRPVALSTEDKAALDDIAEAIGNLAPGDGPGGDASAAKQDEQTALLEAIDGKLASPIDVTFDHPEVQPVSAASLPLPSGAATEAKQDDIISAIESIAPGGGSGGDASAAHQVTQIGLLEAIEAALDGTLTMAGAVSVSGTVPVSGPLTDTQLREAPLAVSGDFYPETQPVSGSVSVSGNVAVTGPITDAQLRADPVPVDVSFPATQTVAGEVSIVGPVAISAEALPLPSNAATAEKQDAAKASLDKLSSAKSWFAITPANSALPATPDAIYVGGDGDLVLRGDDDEDATFTVVAGQILPVSPTQVRASTTATGLVGLVA